MSQEKFFKKSAVISPCGLFRYRLDREVAETGIVIAYYGVNPSTASGEAEDQTTMKWRGFSIRNGARWYIAANPFAFRSTDVRGLASADDPVGPNNEQHLLEIIKEADVHVPCWGDRAKVSKYLRYHFDKLLKLLRESGKPLKCFGLTKGGDPLHPLMLGYDTPLIPM